MRSPGAIDLNGMRRANTAATLRVLQAERTLTLKRLTELTGLSRRTVELIIEALIDEEWVEERSPAKAGKRTGAGRPAKHYAFNPRKVSALAMHIAQDRVEIMVSDLYGSPLGNWITGISTIAERDERLAAVRAAVQSSLASVGIDSDSIAAVTVATMGVIRDDGVVEPAAAEGPADNIGGIPGWSGFAIADALADLFRVRVEVENDAKLAAIGEGWRGSARGVDDYVYVLDDAYGTGIGIVIGGRIYRGAGGAAGEIFRAAPVFRLGPRVSANVLRSIGSPLTAAGQKGAETAARARQGDAEASAVVRELAVEMAPGLHAIAALLSPGLMILGGASSEIGDLVVPALADEFASLPPTDTSLVNSELGSKAVVLGALRASLDRIEAALFDGDGYAELGEAPASDG